jgi:hypothetical protein
MQNNGRFGRTAALIMKPQRAALNVETKRKADHVVFFSDDPHIIGQFSHTPPNLP